MNNSLSNWLFIAFAGCILITATPATAQDAAKVDPEHYTVEFENEHVRIIRITYGPGEKSVMHEHPGGVGVILKGGKTKMSFPNGKSKVQEPKTGQAFWAPATKHLPENVGDEPTELILIEMKNLTKENKRKSKANY